MNVKKMVFTIEQFSQIVNLLNKLQVTGISQAKTLAMIDLILNEGEQITDEQTIEDTEENVSGKDGRK